MLKPNGLCEYDGYSKPNIPADRKPLPLEKEEQLLDELRKDVRNTIKLQSNKLIGNDNN